MAETVPEAVPEPSRSQRVIVRGAGTNALSFVLRFAARAGFLWVGARLFGAGAYGAFSLAVAVVELAVPLASLGLKRMIFPWLEEAVPQRPAGHVLADALVLALLGSALVAGLIMLGAAALPDGVVSDALRLALILLAPALAGQVVGDIALASTRWTHAMRFEVIGRGLIEPYVATGVTVLAWWLGRGANGLVLGYWSGSAALALYALWAARRCLRPLNLRQWTPQPLALARRVRKLATASGSDALTSLAQRVDLYMVGLLLGDAPAGIYSVVRQLRTPVLQVRQSFDGILTPIIARTMAAADDATTGAATAAATRLILTLQLAVVLIMVIAGDAILRLFGAQYGAGYPALVPLALAEAISGAFGVSELILYYRRPGRALALNALLIAVPLAWLPLLAPRLGIAAASVAVLLAALAAALVRRRWLARIGIERGWAHAVWPMVFAGAAGAAGLGLRAVLDGAGMPAAPLLAVLVALGVYGLLVRLWRQREPEALSLARFRV